MVYYLGYLAENMKFSPEALDFGFSPFQGDPREHKVIPHLKPIETKFEEPAKAGQDAISLIIDENFFNSFAIAFTAIEKMYSLRELMNSDPRIAVMKQLLTTTTLGMILPSFKEDYGENRMVDLVGTLSNSFIEEKVEIPTKTGLSLDGSNGVLKITLNLGA